jgi:TPR repeat protein
MSNIPARSRVGRPFPFAALGLRGSNGGCTSERIGACPHQRGVRRSIAGWLLVLLVGLIGGQQIAHAGSAGRLALIVGNADYGGLLWDVPTAQEDARLIQTTLKEFNFDPSLLLNSSRAQLETAVEQLARRVGDLAPGISPTVLVYFSGRAAPSERDQDTLLIPAGSKLRWPVGDESLDLPEGTRASWIVDRLTRAGAARVLLLMDASRPLPLRLTRRGSAKTGIAALPAFPSARADAPAADIFIGASAQPGQEGVDNVFGRHSYFSRAIAGALAIPGLSFSDAFLVARERVKADTGGRQIPISSGSGGFVLWSVSDWNQLSHGGIQAVLKTRSLLDLEVDLQRGDGYAAHFLGLAHWDGVGGAKKDLALAEKYFRKGAELRIGSSANALGYLYASGERGPPDYVEAIKWYGIGVELGAAIAMSNLGFLYQKGQGVPKDALQAERLYKLAAAQGSPRGYWNLGWLYSSDEHGLKNLPQARALHERALSAGFFQVAVSLSQGLRQGSYGKPDPTEADRILQQAADQGCATCWTEIGAVLSRKDDSPYTVTRSAQAYRKGAEGGDPVAMVDLARRYLSGKGVPKDSHFAYVWFQKAHEAGNPEGTGGLGRLLVEEKDVEKDPERAAALLKQVLALEADPAKRYSVYVPNYWSYGNALAKLHDSGAIQGASADEAKRLRARYGPETGMKRFTVPIDCGNHRVPFHVYLVDWERDEPPTEEQAEWLQSQRGCTMPTDVRDSFLKLYKIARENKVKFTDLAVYAMGAGKEKSAGEGKVQAP